MFAFTIQVQEWQKRTAETEMRSKIVLKRRTEQTSGKALNEIHFKWFTECFFRVER